MTNLQCGVFTVEGLHFVVEGQLKASHLLLHCFHSIGLTLINELRSVFKPAESNLKFGLFDKLVDFDLCLFNLFPLQ